MGEAVPLPQTQPRGCEWLNGEPAFDPERHLQLEEPAEVLMLADIEHCIDTHDDDDLIATETAVSCMIGMHLTSNWNPRGVRASAALAHAETIGTPAVAVVAAGISAYGPATVRDRARQVLARLGADGVVVPEWAASLGAAEPVSAVKFRDEWDEHWTLVVDYARPDGSAHEVCASLHPFGWGMAHDLAVAPAGQSALRLAESGLVAEAISLEEARGLLVQGIEHLDDAVKDWWDNDDLDLDADIDLRTLVGQRIEILPGGEHSGSNDADDDSTAEHVADVVRGFVELPVPLGENKLDLAGFVVAATMFSQACRDADVLRWTPPKVETFVERFLPLWTAGDDPGDYDPFDEFGEPDHAFEFGEERLSTLDSAMPRWLRYAAERRGERADVLEANLAAAKSSLRKLRVEITGSPIPLAAPRIQWA